MTMKYTASVLTIGLCLLAGGCGQNFGAHRINGETYLAAGQWDKAAPELEQYLEHRPGEADVRAGLAQAYMRMGDFPRAADHLRLVHTQVPGNEKYTDMLCDALLAAGKNDELYRTLRTEALERQNASDWLRMGNYAMKLGDKDTAQAALLAAAKVDAGRTWKPHVALFDYYRSMGLKREAIDRLRMAAYVAPMEAEVNRRIDSSGVINGPTFPMRPLEWEMTEKPSIFDLPAFLKPAK